MINFVNPVYYIIKRRIIAEPWTYQRWKHMPWKIKHLSFTSHNFYYLYISIWWTKTVCNNRSDNCYDTHKKWFDQAITFICKLNHYNNHICNMLNLIKAMVTLVTWTHLSVASLNLKIGHTENKLSFIKSVW